MLMDAPGSRDGQSAGTGSATLTRLLWPSGIHGRMSRPECTESSSLICSSRRPICRGATSICTARASPCCIRVALEQVVAAVRARRLLVNETTPVTTPAPPSPSASPALTRAAWISAALLGGLIVPGIGAVILGALGAVFAAKRHHDRTLLIVIVLAVVAAAAAVISF